MTQENKTITAHNAQITEYQFSSLQRLFNFFNAELFGGSLPNCLLNLSRKSKAMGFYSPDRWSTTDEDNKVIVDEISLNPDFLHISQKEYCQTLVHEMCHLWQYKNGKPTPGYHNKEFAAKMEEVGLMPSHTGKPGGKKTGKRMADYAIEGGAFEFAYAKLVACDLLPFVAKPDLEKKKAQKKKNKIKYTCPQCQANAWGKPGLMIACGECSEPDNLINFFAEESEDDLLNNISDN